MKITNSPKAVTLLELIIVISIFSFLALGSLLSTTALQKSTQDYGVQYFNNSSTRETLNHILNNASLAIGSSTDKGILIGMETGNANTSCMRVSSVDPVWRCYTLISHNIYRCSKLTAGACSNSDTFLGTAVSIGSSFAVKAGGPVFSLNNTAGSQSVLFSISITNRLNPSADATTTGTNPEVTLTGSVSPAQHSI